MCVYCHSKSPKNDRVRERVEKRKRYIKPKLKKTKALQILAAFCMGLPYFWAFNVFMKAKCLNAASKFLPT